MARLTWDQWNLSKARFAAGRSRDPSTKVGAYITRADNSPVSDGYNDFARGVRHREERYVVRDVKYALTVHAELNAILHAREPLHGYTLYVWPFQPCVACASAIVNAGIARVVTVRDECERWTESFTLARMVFSEGGVALDFIDLPA